MTKKHKYIFSIIGVIIIALALFVYVGFNKINYTWRKGSSPQPSVSVTDDGGLAESFKCPDEYANDATSSDKYSVAINKWTDNFNNEHPDATIADWSKARYQLWVDNKCTSAIEIYNEAQAGKATKVSLDLECPFISTAFTGECLDNVLSRKEKQANDLVKSLVESTNLKIKEGYEYSVLLSSLDEYNKQWISYRNEKCDLIDSYIGGTAIVEESRKCFIHETDEYIQILKDLEAWVNGKSK